MKMVALDSTCPRWVVAHVDMHLREVTVSILLQSVELRNLKRLCLIVAMLSKTWEWKGNHAWNEPIQLKRKVANFHHVY